MGRFRQGTQRRPRFCYPAPPRPRCASSICTARREIKGIGPKRQRRPIPSFGLPAAPVKAGGRLIKENAKPGAPATRLSILPPCRTKCGKDNRRMRSKPAEHPPTFNIIKSHRTSPAPSGGNLPEKSKNSGSPALTEFYLFHFPASAAMRPRRTITSHIPDLLYRLDQWLPPAEHRHCIWPRLPLPPRSTVDPPPTINQKNKTTGAIACDSCNSLPSPSRKRTSFLIPPRPPLCPRTITIPRQP